ncbi:hypothetical protein GTZ99_14745 [Novosphingobium sp. FSY-8]|uniref:Uncharacterized protein n=1 Tax=Novosphingobium ovatum TaxID=1908523 RepID=A0ABW9XH44_9SPHN|nr:hypothetical protein [Novosphingobium ovatum]NBC37811.1 hypothetical protein [Novosphingobium ovatum]
MAISEDEAAKLIAHIETTLREVASDPRYAGIIDLLNQWRSDVEAGRRVDRKLPVHQSPGVDVLTEVPRSRTTTSGEFVGKEDYTAIEQLDLLVAALGVAFLAPQMMATRFLNAITTYGGDSGAKIAHENPQIHLVGVGDTGAVDSGPRISSNAIAQSRDAVMTLARLLDEVTQEGNLTARNLSAEAEIV